MKTCNSPNIVLGLFKALFNQAGMNCRTFDLPLLLASQVGYKRYTYLDQSIDDLNILHSLWAPYVWGDKFYDTTDNFLGRLSKLGLRPTDIGAQLIVTYSGENGWIETFLKTSMHLLFNSGFPTVIGFSCSAIQVLPSLALGQRIKKKYPEVKLVYGGSAFFDEMGYEFMEKIPWIDAVATGESDDTVVPLFRSLATGREPAGLNGILYRYGDDKVRTGPAYHPVSQDVFASLPDPEYDDFFDLAGKMGLYADNNWCQNFFLSIEGSRGCSWGQRSQCTFCGVNGKGMRIRKKSGDQFHASITALATKHSIFTMFAVDSNFLDEYYDTVISKLAARGPNELLDIIVEVRPDIGRQKLQKLVKAGTWRLQVGIENLSTGILKLFRKGSNSLQNIYFLKLCRQYGVIPVWYYLTRVPGEQPSNYSRWADTIPYLHHLQPPDTRSPIPINLERFNVYYNEKKAVKNIRPKAWYEYQFPKDRFDLLKIAYIFDAEWEDTLKPEAYTDLHDALGRWWDLWYTRSDPPGLIMKELPAENGLYIVDTRDPDNPRERVLESATATVFKLLDDPITANAVNARLKTASADSCMFINEDDVQRILKELVAGGLVVQEKQTYLGLALPGD